MFCSECGEDLAETLLQGEARMLAHRLFRHSSPEVQTVATLVLTALASWVVSQAWRRLS
jgi:hypothetical protein